MWWSAVVALFTTMVMLLFKQKTAYEMRISDWSSDVCSSDLKTGPGRCCINHPDRAASALHGIQFFLEGVQRQGAVHARAVGKEQIGRASCRERVCQYV